MSKKNRGQRAQGENDESREDDAADDIHSADRAIDDSEDDDERLDDGTRDLRASREADTREAVSRENTEDDERLDAFRRSLFQSALPALPEMEGYHLCWLTTANPRDPLPGRLRLGYELLKPEQVPGFEHVSMKQGDYAGYVGVNEMVAARIPLRIYEMLMNEAHHVAPNQEEDKLRAMNEVIAEEAKKQSGRAPQIGNGTAALGKGPRRGVFEGVNHVGRRG